MVLQDKFPLSKVIFAGSNILIQNGVRSEIWCTLLLPSLCIFILLLQGEQNKHQYFEISLEMSNTLCH